MGLLAEDLGLEEVRNVAEAILVTILVDLQVPLRLCFGLTAELELFIGVDEILPSSLHLEQEQVGTILQLVLSHFFESLELA